MSRYTEKIPRKFPDVLTDTARVLSSNTFLKHIKGTAIGSRKQAWHIPDAACTVFELLMMGEETVRNM